MSNKKAYILGILTVFAFNIGIDIISEAIYLRTKRKLAGSGIVVGVELTSKNESKDAKETEKEES